MKTILEHVGDTPLVNIENNIFAKMEGFNPGGSIKQGDTLIEPTSGNTGIGLAMVAAMKGYKVKVIMPESTSKEKIKMVRVFGGEVILMENLRYRKFAINDVKDMAKNGERHVFLNQYENLANPESHYYGTAEEILKQMGEKQIDYFIAGMGTGGTITGIGRKLKEKYPNIKIIGVQPVQNQTIEGLRSLKDGFVPTIIDFDLIDEIYDLEAEKALNVKDELAKKGVLVGPSSGAAMYVCQEIQQEHPEVTIVTVFPDRGERYL